MFHAARLAAMFQSVIGDDLAPFQGLEQGIVKIARDAGAFLETVIEAGVHCRGNLPCAEPVGRCQRQCDRQSAERFKPWRLVESGSNRKAQDGAGLVPHAVVIARDHAELIVSWAEIRVESLAPRLGILPSLVQSLRARALQ